MRRHCPLVFSVCALSLAVVVLHAAGARVGSPPVASLSRWPAWLTSQDPMVIAFGLARLAALAAAWYLLAVTVLGAAVRLARARHAVSVLDRLTLPAVRRLLAASLGITLLSATPSVAGPVRRTPAAVATTGRGSEEPPPPTITMHRLPDDDRHVVAPHPPPATPRAQAADHWHVEPGQSFWSIAETVLGRARRQPPTDAEIVPYWRRLIDANRPALPDPDNPDLLFPGQVLTVPPADGADSPRLAATT